MTNERATIAASAAGEWAIVDESAVPKSRYAARARPVTRRAWVAGEWAIVDEPSAAVASARTFAGDPSVARSSAPMNVVEAPAALASARALVDDARPAVRARPLIRLISAFQTNTPQPAVGGSRVAWAAGEWAITGERSRPAIVVERKPARRARASHPRGTWAAGEWAMPPVDEVSAGQARVETAGVPHEPLPPARAPMSRLPALPAPRESTPRMTMTRWNG